MQVSIIVPTYNEKDNIKPLVERIARALRDREYEIVIIDDNSPDGTAQLAADLGQTYPVRVIKRRGKFGLGSAIIEGFKNSAGEIMGVIDADLQHPPEVIPELVTTIENGADIAIASRHVPGAGVENWTAFRRAVSKGAIFLARPLTKVKDPMSGYFFIERRVIEKGEFTATGYKLLLEILAKGKYHQVKEVPYVFRSRQAGKSKLGLTEYLRYLSLLSHLYWHKAKSKLTFKVESRAAGTRLHTSFPCTLVSNLPQNRRKVEEDKKLRISIGVCAYNEDENIGNLLRSLQSQNLGQVEIAQIVVVSSACHDKTDEIVQSFSDSDPKD